MNRYTPSIMLGILLLLMTSWIMSGTEKKLPELLSTEETLVISKLEKIDGVDRIYHPDAWRGNPDALKVIYKAILSGTEINELKNMVSYIGIIGGSDDIEKLESLLPSKNTTIQKADKLGTVTVATLFALSTLGTRGFVEARSILHTMISPEYWKFRNIQAPFWKTSTVLNELSYAALIAYCMSGAEDADSVISEFISYDPSKMGENTLDLKNMPAVFKTNLQKYNLWDNHNKPLEIAQMLSDMGYVPKSIDYAANDKEKIAILMKTMPKTLSTEQVDLLISNILDIENPKGFTELSRKVEQSVRDKIFKDIKEDTDDPDIYKKILFLGFSGDKVEFSFLIDYLATFSGITLDELGIKKLGATMTALSSLTIKKYYPQKMSEFPINKSQYWAISKITLCQEKQLSQDALDNVNSLSYAGMLAKNIGRFHKDQESIDECVQMITKEEKQSKILRELIDKHFLPFIENFAKNLEPNSQDTYLKVHVFEEIVKILSGPVTVERLTQK